MKGTVTGTRLADKLLLFLAIWGTIWFIPQRASAAELCVQLKWLHQSQFAGFYAAQELGYYQDEGITVHFVEGGPGLDWSKLMADPSCPVGITNAHNVVVAREKGIPIVAVAAVNQVSPIVFFSLRSSGIRDPRQFKGKSVAMLDNARLQFHGMLKRVGVNPKDVRLEPFSLKLTRLYEGKVDIWSGYHTNLVTMAEEQGYQVNVIHPIDYGIQVYDDVIYVNTKLLKEDPGLVLKFIRASLKGWTFAIKNPSSAVGHTLKFAKNTSRRHEENLLKRTIPYVHTGEEPVGWMEYDVWENIVRLTKATGFVENDVEPEEVFNLKFLKQIYYPEAAGNAD